MKNKTVILIINDEYYNSEEAKLTERSILKHLGGVHRIMIMSFTFFTEKGFYAVPFNTTLVTFVIKKSERKICDTLLYKYIPMSARVDFYYINEEEKKEEKKDMEKQNITVSYEKIKDTKKTIDDLFTNHSILRMVEIEFENNKIAKEYLDKANKYAKDLHLDDTEYYASAIKNMADDIKNYREACALYEKDIEMLKKNTETLSKELQCCSVMDMKKLQAENTDLIHKNCVLQNKIDRVIELMGGVN